VKGGSSGAARFGGGFGWRGGNGLGREVVAHQRGGTFFDRFLATLEEFLHLTLFARHFALSLLLLEVGLRHVVTFLCFRGLDRT
jgi:hypothetical protein